MFRSSGLIGGLGVGLGICKHCIGVVILVGRLSTFETLLAFSVRGFSRLDRIGYQDQLLVILCFNVHLCSFHLYVRRKVTIKHNHKLISPLCYSPG